MQKISVNNADIAFSGSKKPKKTLNVKESCAAYGASALVPVATMPLSLAAMNKMQKTCDSLSIGQVESIKTSANTMLNQTGLAEKGVTIKRLSEDSVRTLADSVDNKFYKKLIEFVDPISSTKSGKNAFFSPKEIFGLCNKNTVVLHENKLSLSVFHELGHAMNFNMSKVGKLLQKCRMPAMLIAGSLALFAAFSKESKAEDGKELTKGQKAKNFVRKNAGVLAFTSMLPILAEEGMASIKGCLWANKNIAKDLAKKVAKTNAVAYTSYLLAAIGLGLSAHVAVKVKDKLVAKKEAKLASELGKTN